MAHQLLVRLSHFSACRAVSDRSGVGSIVYITVVMLMNSWHSTEDIQYTAGTQHYICVFDIRPDALAWLNRVPSKFAAWIMLGYAILRSSKYTYTLCPGVQIFPTSPWSSLHTAPSPAEPIGFQETKKANLGRSHVNALFSGAASRRVGEHMDNSELEQDRFAATSWCCVYKGSG